MRIQRPDHPLLRRHAGRIALALAAIAGVHHAPALAQEAAASAPTGAHIGNNDRLYRQLGGEAGLVKLMDDFVPRLLADPRMEPFFKDVNLPHLKAQLIAQFCEVSGGPCKLKGPNMKLAHAGVDITRNDFNALVEVLQQSMDAQGIPFTTQNQLLAKLAPMHRDIINTP